MLLQVGAVPPKRREGRGKALGRRAWGWWEKAVDIDPAGVGREVGGAQVPAGGPDGGRLPAGRTDPEELRALTVPDKRVDRLFQIAGRGTNPNDSAPIGRPGRDLIEGAFRDQSLGLATRKVDSHQRPFVPVPRHVGQRRAVRRPGRIVLAGLGGGDPAGGSVRQVRHVEPIERGERDPAAIGRWNGFPNLANREGRGVFDRVFELDLGSDGHLGVDHEGDLGRRRAVDRDPPQFAAVRQDDGQPIRRERITGQEIEIRH